MGFVAGSWNIVRKQMIKEWNKGERGTEKRCFKRVKAKVHQIFMKVVDIESTVL